MKKIWIITLFPDYFVPLINFGIIGQALRGERGNNIEMKFVQLRDYTAKTYKGVDDTPYGGGPGMVIRADVLKRALVEGVVSVGEYGEYYRDKLHIIYPSPRGNKLDNKISKNLSLINKDLVFICGRYEGIDERFIELYIDQQICLGDFILSGGEIATMAIIDSFMRFQNGVLGNGESFGSESFENGRIEHPQYTRPLVFDGIEVPEVLLSGNHKKIENYRESESIRLTEIHRPDLIKKDEN